MIGRCKPHIYIYRYTMIGRNNIDEPWNFEASIPEDPHHCRNEQILPCDPSYPYRSIDGSCNNLIHPTWGIPDECYMRLQPAYYEGYDGVRKSKNGDPLPSARDLTLNVFKEGYRPSPNVSFMFTIYGQTVAHDLSHSENVNSNREQVNAVTAALDASLVYEKKNKKLMELRANDGTGDLRGNQHFFLTGIVTIFVREHNRIATNLKKMNPHWEEERLFQESRVRDNIPKELRILLRNKSVEDIDLFVGIQMENFFPEAAVGPTTACIIAMQFYSNKFGDRFFFEHVGLLPSFTAAQRNSLKQCSLSRLFCDNSNITHVQKNLMLLPSITNPEVPCEDIPEVDLSLWAESPSHENNNSLNA
ncbi:Peroxidase like protein [Argiope bruennichi]|uniref:Peroxidase like protein n=1 Tax=Argiope bruennichi TaxID=94029 RepID=A0A8T0EIL9_ARGBR|nr:Peroxidase like protein [Argiope bruennichi]